jgi:hypothetical protein
MCVHKQSQTDSESSIKSRPVNVTHNRLRRAYRVAQQASATSAASPCCRRRRQRFGEHHKFLVSSREWIPFDVSHDSVGGEAHTMSCSLRIRIRFCSSTLKQKSLAISQRRWACSMASAAGVFSHEQQGDREVVDPMHPPQCPHHSHRSRRLRRQSLFLPAPPSHPGRRRSSPP